MKAELIETGMYLKELAVGTYAAYSATPKGPMLLGVYCENSALHDGINGAQVPYEVDEKMHKDWRKKEAD